MCDMSVVGVLAIWPLGAHIGSEVGLEAHMMGGKLIHVRLLHVRLGGHAPSLGLHPIEVRVVGDAVVVVLVLVVVFLFYLNDRGALVKLDFQFSDSGKAGKIKTYRCLLEPLPFLELLLVGPLPISRLDGWPAGGRLVLTMR